MISAEVKRLQIPDQFELVEPLLVGTVTLSIIPTTLLSEQVLDTIANNFKEDLYEKAGKPFVVNTNKKRSVTLEQNRDGRN